MKLKPWIVLTAAVPLLLAACSAAAPSPEPPTATGITPDPATLEATRGPDQPTTEPTQAGETESPPPTETTSPPPDVAALPESGETVNPPWRVESLATGIKPALALGSDDTPHLIFMSESEHGYVKYAVPGDQGWEIETVAEGYFYGPPAIALSPDDIPNLLWHDHQDMQFQPELGDATRAVRRDGEWFVSAIEDDGHDGWDNSIVVDSQGRVHTAGIDPSQFDSPDGVEYAVFSGRWSVEAIGSGPIQYEFGTAIDVNSQDLPAITFYDDPDRGLIFAQRGLDGNWTLQRVDPDENTGKFSSLAFGSNDAPHISYYAETGRSGGEVRYATWDGTQWQIEVVDQLSDVRQGAVGARHLTWLAVDSQGRPHLAYNDRSELKYAVRSTDGWQVETVARAGPFPFSQLVVLDLDSQDRPHLVYAVFTEPNIPSGVIRYAVREALP